MTEQVSDDYFWTGVGLGGTNHERMYDQTRNRLDLMTADERACTVEQRCKVDFKASSFSFLTSMYANGGIITLASSTVAVLFECLRKQCPRYFRASVLVTYTGTIFYTIWDPLFAPHFNDAG